MAAPRLPWKRNPSSGFIAYPDGEAHPDRFATVAPAINLGGNDIWRWATNYGGARRSGEAATKQDAADAATEAWPSMPAEADALRATSLAKSNIAELVSSAVQTGELPGLDVATKTYEFLLELNRHLGDEFARRRK